MGILQRQFKYNFVYVTVALAVVNVLVFVITGSGMVRGLNSLLCLNPYLFLHKKYYWQIFTYMFMHASWRHLLGNMFGLLMFGTTLERRIGSKEFLLFYLLCGTVCGAFSVATYILTGMWTVFLLGASGAVYAVLLLFSVVFPTARVFVYWLIPVPVPILIVIYAGISVWNEIFGWNSGVAHSTHLVGFAAAWIYCLVRFRVNPIKIWKDAWR